MHIRRALVNIVFIFVMVVLLLLTIWLQRQYLLISFAVVFVSILFLFYRFESRKVEARELVLLAVLAAIAAACRIPFASIPSVQPTTFVIMMSGMVFGAESGFIVGAVAALASNMLLGQGPWTPWQMAAWGLVGLTAGLLRNTGLLKRKWGQILFGIMWGFLFGWIMNLWGILGLAQSGSPITLKAILVYYAASATFDSFHAASNVFFLFLFGENWLKILTRFKRKYGLLESFEKTSTLQK